MKYILVTFLYVFLSFDLNASEENNDPNEDDHNKPLQNLVVPNEPSIEQDLISDSEDTLIDVLDRLEPADFFRSMQVCSKWYFCCKSNLIPKCNNQAEIILCFQRYRVTDVSWRMFRVKNSLKTLVESNEFTTSL